MEPWHRAGLASRLREIREDLCGEFGAQFLADSLGIPVQTWLNYESGVTMPAQTLLELIVMARVSPDWLLTGQGKSTIAEAGNTTPTTMCRQGYPRR